MDELVIMGNSLVSVILPVYNGEKYLAEAINCVLKQEYHPVEIIVIDDGSIDNTARVANTFIDDVRYFYRTNSGPAAARNFGIRKAKGEFIAFIDADDIWPDNKLRLQMNCFEAFPEVEIVQGIVRRIRTPDLIGGRSRVDDDIQFINTNLGAMVIRRSVFDKIGYFEENFKYHEDSDFWLRARESGIKILIQRKISLIYRIHGTNLTTGMDVSTLGFTNILKRSINRRRKSNGDVQNIPKLTFIPDMQKSATGNYHQTRQKVISWPLISIVLHAGVNQENVGKALESIYKQDYQPCELIVVGPGLDRVQGLNPDLFERVEYIENNLQDLAAQLNVSLEKCKGELITFLDLNAEWAPGKLRTQVNYLIENSMGGYCVGRTRVIIDPKTKYPSDLLDGIAFRTSLGDLLDTLMVSKSILEEVGGFTSGLAGMEETDWFLRASDMGFPKKMLPEVFLYRFVHPDADIFNMDQMRSALLESVHASVLRKRNAGKSI